MINVSQSGDSGLFNGRTCAEAFRGAGGGAGRGIMPDMEDPAMYACMSHRDQPCTTLVPMTVVSASFMA